MWSSYGLDDFLLFSPATYYRLFELYNADLAPGQWLAGALSLLLLWWLRQGRARAALVLLAAGWLWVAWGYHLQRYASIHWAAPGFALGFAVQGLLLLALAATPVQGRADRAGRIGLALLLFAIAVQPLLGLLFGRPWQQAEWFGLAPDPTAVGTLGLLLWLRNEGAPRRLWLLWPLPLAWCLVSGATRWTMQSPDAALMAAVLALVVATAWRRRRRR